MSVSCLKYTEPTKYVQLGIKKSPSFHRRSQNWGDQDLGKMDYLVGQKVLVRFPQILATQGDTTFFYRARAYLNGPLIRL
jgi:hypothetical protein